METATVPVKSAWASKINWGEAAKVIGMALTLTTIPADVQKDILALIIAGGSIYTWVMRTWFNGSVSPGSVS